MRVAGVGNFLTASLRLNVINDGRDIVFTHLKPGVVPELLIVLVRVVFYVRTAEGVASRVAEPNIVAGFGSV